MYENNIGKKAWVFVNEGFLYRLDKDTTYTIKDKVRKKTFDGTREYDWGYLLIDEQGNEKEVERGYLVIAPNTDLDELSMVSRYLADNDCYSEVFHDGNEVVVCISWGDWKHDHGWAVDLMDYIGYMEVSMVETEENGSDCYSADHYFAKRAE
jgi:hypothetical protein